MRGRALKDLALVDRGTMLVGADMDGRLRLWNLDPLRTARRVAGRHLSRTEWQRDLGEIGYRSTFSDLPAGR